MQVRFDGADELKKKLDKLGNAKAAKRIARKAARQAMNIVRDAARNAAKAIDDPETPEKIHKEIVVQSGKSRNINEINIRVGVRGGARVPYTSNADNRRAGRIGKTYQMEGKVFYWRFIEFGTRQMPARPFMRPALQNNIDSATSKFAEVFSVELDKEMGL